MAQIQKKFIAPNAVDDTKVRLSNNATLRARNALDSADIDILKVDSSDKVQMASFFQTPTSAPTSNYDTANKKYVDDSITAATPTAASVSYDHTSSGPSATTVQGAIDELETQIDATETSIGHLQTLSGVAASADDLGTFSGTTIGDNETVKQALQDLETAVETKANDSIVIKKDGSVSYTANQPMGAHKLTGLSAGSTIGDSVRYEQVILASGANPWSANQDLGGNKITGSADPTSAQDLATKAYVDTIAVGLSPKKAVLVASTGSNLTLAGEQTIDGTLTSTSRVLVKDQTLASQNGIYVSAAGAWTRATDFDSVSPVDEINGAWVPVELGTINAGRVYIQYATVTTVGVDPITFEFYNPIASLIGGDMITVSGSTISIDLATASGLESSNPGNAAGQLRIKLEASNPSLKFTGSNELAAKLDAAGAIASGASGLAVQVDGTTIEISTDALRVKDAGITLAKLASNSVDENKIVSTVVSATGAITGGGGSKFAVAVDGTTIEISGNAIRVKDNSISNAKLAQIATQTFKGRTTASTGNVEDLSATQATAILNAFVGDSGSGGTKGLVPAPSSGDAAANKFLKADGSFATIQITESQVTNLTTDLAAKQSTTLTSAHILVGNVSNVATDVAVTGDITITNAGVTAIGTNKVTNAQLAQMAAHTFKGNNTGSTANALDLTATQLTAELNAMVGDSGSGGTKGLVPAPAAGDAAASKFLKADGTWATVTATGSTGDIAQTSFAASNNQSSAANVTGLAFANASVRSAEVLYSIALVATASKYQMGKLYLIQRGADWQMSEEFSGDDAGFVFTVTTAGQIQYTSPNSAGFSSATIKFRAQVTSV